MGSSVLRDIHVREYRTDLEDMQIVSGAWNKEKVHFVAPPPINGIKLSLQRPISRNSR